MLHVVRFALWSTKNSRPSSRRGDSQPVGRPPGDITPSRSSVGAWLSTSQYFGGGLRFWWAAGSSKNSMSWAFGTEFLVPTQRQSSLSCETVSAPRRSRVAPVSSLRTRSFVGRATFGGGAKGVGAVVVAVPPAQRVRGLRQRLAPGREQHGTALGPLLGPQRCSFCGAGASSRGRLLPELLGSRVGFAAEDAAHRAPSL